MRRLFRVSLVSLLVVTSVLLTIAVAGAEIAGSSPATAIPLTGPVTGTLDPHQSRWYQFNGDGASPAGVTMDFTPTNNPSGASVYFNVDWTTPNGVANADWPGYFRVGQGTPSGLPVGQRYWFTGTSAATTYAIQVVNGSDLPIGYALALTGAAFPPPFLNPPAPGAPALTRPPPPTPVATVTPLPTASASSTTSTTTTPNTATDRSGLILDPRIIVEGPFSTVDLRVDSSSLTQVRVYRVRIRPPDSAVVDGVTPSESRNEDGVTWYTGQLVDQADPMTGYSVRFFGPANGAVVEVDWATATDKGSLVLTVSGAPNPAPPGQ